MTTLVNALTAAALGSALVTLVGTGSWRLALRVLLDLLMAAGLLRLAGRPALPALAVVVVVVALRFGLSTALGLGGSGPGSGNQTGRRTDSPGNRAGSGRRTGSGRAGGAGCHPGRCRE
ncbi:hypothetical protein [Micromonospora echinofusca]|uniref:DUF1622 domain-containing protein n=1 Tax=Micromonospora echinofusca TaxID=47858 RepID=A0ABS3W1N0_MICEH|nr:hypothetical protein [Micromonospora echinofusca]MBO4210704.1 hypothetical protein [Micromonospora echinofusca]